MSAEELLPELPTSAVASADPSAANAGDDPHAPPPTSDAPVPQSAPQGSPDTIHHNSSDFITDPSISLPIFTPNAHPSLTPKQLAALALLTSGKSISAAASMLGVHRTTIQLWKRNPAFAAQLESRRAELRETIDARLYRILLHATHSCIASLKVKDVDQSHRNAFRLMSTLRPWMPRIDALLDHPPKEYEDSTRVPPRTPNDK